MKKVFYLAMCSSVLLFACQQSASNSALDVASSNTPAGESSIVNFSSLDGLKITADYYPNDSAKTIILMLHQDGFSRGEYKDIAPKMVKNGYACLAVDLRRGKQANNIPNATAAAALVKGVEPSYDDAMQDIKASVAFLAAQSDKKIVLWGSSYSASLGLILATTEPNIAKVIAFSPGEYLSTPDEVAERVQYISKPVFITGGFLEYDQVVKPIAMLMPKNTTTSYKQPAGSDHGSKTLFSNSPRVDTLYQMLFDFL